MSLVPKILIGLAVLATGYVGYMYMTSHSNIGVAAPSQISYANWEGGSPYSINNKEVYFNGTKLQGADPLTFTAYYFDTPGGGDTYGKDASHVYFFGFLMPEADPKTFEVFNTLQSCGVTCRFEAKDKNHKYFQDGVVQESSQTLAVKPLFQVNNSFYECEYRKYTESNCSLFKRNGVTRTNLGFSVEDASSSLVLSPDQAHLLVVNEQKIVIVKTSNGEKYKLINAPEGKVFGVYTAFPTFLGRARWLTATSFEVDLYPAWTDQESLLVPEEQIVHL